MVLAEACEHYATRAQSIADGRPVGFFGHRVKGRSTSESGWVSACPANQCGREVCNNKKKKGKRGDMGEMQMQTTIPPFTIHNPHTQHNNQQRRGFDEKQAWHAHSAARWWVEHRGDHHPRVEYGLSTLKQAFVPSHAWLVRSHRKDFVALRVLVRDFRHDHLVTSSG